jgi:2-polyprenyl-3-methyl-5-hydroxy-6-metoxy-1,4-benzoquinol methylase
MTSVSESDIKKGQAVYTPIMLKIYNIWVLDISNRWIWRCPKEKQVAQFNKYITSNHLDIGVGTGYYLKTCKMPHSPKLSLMDLNLTCLNKAQKALHQKSITTTLYQADVFKKQTALAERFNSISMNYLLHCLPGNMQTKEKCIANAVSMLMPGGVLFGATIVSDKKLHILPSRMLSNFYNQRGIFSNQEDTSEALLNALGKHLIDIDISIVGCVALFKGVKRF